MRSRSPKGVRGAAARNLGASRRAHEGRLAALGHASWDDYVTCEFDPAAHPSYRLVDRAPVGLGDDRTSEVEPSASEARDVQSQGLSDALRPAGGGATAH